MFATVDGALIRDNFASTVIHHGRGDSDSCAATFFFGMTLDIIFCVTLCFTTPTVTSCCGVPPLMSLTQIVFVTVVVGTFIVVPGVVLAERLQFGSVASTGLVNIIISDIVAITVTLTNCNC